MLRKLTISEVLEILAKDKDAVFYDKNEEYYVVQKIDTSSYEYYIVSTKDSTAKWITDIYLKTEPKMRTMTRFEAMKKAEELSAENAKLDGKIWLCCCTRSNYSDWILPTEWLFLEDIDKHFYAQFDLKGNKLTEDFKFEVEDDNN